MRDINLYKGYFSMAGSFKRSAMVAMLGASVLALGAITTPANMGLGAQPASAQSVYTAVLVNDVPITNYDVDARAALLRLQGASSSQANTRAEDELIDEALQRAEARRLGISVTQPELDGALQEIAGRSGVSVSQLGQALGQRGVDIASLRDSIESQILWGQIIRARFQATIQVDEQDVLAALDSRNGDDAGTGLTATEYTLREVIFIVPDGTSQDQRMREAAAFRSRFESCSTGIASARQLNGVVIQDEVRRFSSDIPADLAQIFNETPVGRLTAPEATNSGGVEMIAVCNKREVQSDGDARRDIESELRNEEGVLLSRGYLRDLRASATILRPSR